ncbi:archaeal proteasome endopeptidase complex subunit beta [Methanocaldococcus indicus]|uniref:archaeal proteasome endopeptidase complex subunit beta n=1 Tax=Methanocaldococcus indicus TaxID=213231 RepID=UPI003C6D24E8
MRMKGTTTVGLIYKDGVILAADKRASMGNLIADKNAKKVHKIDDYLALTISGSVGDAQAIIRYLIAEARLYRMRAGRYLAPKNCATLLSNILHSSRFYPYLTMLILGGYNLDENKGELFSIDPLGGFSEEYTFTATGSGSPVAYGVLEAEYKKDLPLDKAIKLAIKAIKAASERDTFTGNGISLAVINKEGVKILEDEEIDNFLKSLRKK